RALRYAATGCRRRTGRKVCTRTSGRSHEDINEQAQERRSKAIREFNSVFRRIPAKPCRLERISRENFNGLQQNYLMISNRELLPANREFSVEGASVQRFLPYPEANTGLHRGTAKELSL